MAGDLTIGKQEIKELYDRVGKLEIQDKVKDEKIDTLIGISKDTLQSVQEHTKVFKQHDEKEMKKYEESDKHIMELTNTVNTIASGFEEIKQDLVSHKKAIEDNKKETDDIIKDIVGKQNRFYGGLAAIVFVLGISFSIVNYISDQQEKRVVEKQLLDQKINRLEIYVNRNHVALEDIKKP